MIHTGDCVTVMAAMDAESVDAIVTDPPYGLEFMGRSWDRLENVGQTSSKAPIAGGPTPYHRARVAYSGSANKKCRRCGKWAWDYPKNKCKCEVPDFPNVAAHQGRLMQDWHHRWATEALRVTKPGGYLLAFGGTRTHHRLVCGLEDAGWIIRDELTWIYASGFPKGRANLKPAHEPIVLARKPGPLRPLNIEETRIASVTVEGAGLDVNTHLRPSVRFTSDENSTSYSVHPGEEGEYHMPAAGRWPSNVLLSDPELFDAPNPDVVGSGAVIQAGTAVNRNRLDGSGGYGGWARGDGADVGYGDTGGYSRFFTIPHNEQAAEAVDREATYNVDPKRSPSAAVDYPRYLIVPKAGRGDREPVLREYAPQADVAGVGALRDGGRPSVPRFNLHPTVKPVDLMRHLVRLVTPPGGTVLDPFLGSGSTAIACELEGFAWVGIEKEPEYVAIAEARLNGTQRGMGLDTPLVGKSRKVDSRVARGDSPGYHRDSLTSWFTADPDEEPAA